MVIHIQVHPLHFSLCNEWIFNRRNFRKTLEREHTWVFKPKLIHQIFLGTCRASGLYIHADDLLCTLRDDSAVLFECEFKTARAAYPLPVDQPKGEIEYIVL